MDVRIEQKLGVQATTAEVWAVLADLPGWAAWNPTYPEAQGALRIGEMLTLKLHLPGQKEETIRPTVVDWIPEEQIVWRLSLARGLVKTVRYIELEELGPNNTVISNGEMFGGLLGGFVAKRLRGSLKEGFAAMNEALVRHVENLRGTPPAPEPRTRADRDAMLGRPAEDVDQLGGFGGEGS